MSNSSPTFWDQRVLHLLEGVGPHITRYATYVLLKHDKQTYYPQTSPDLLNRFEAFADGIAKAGGVKW